MLRDIWSRKSFSRTLLKAVNERIKNICTHSDNACVMDISLYLYYTIYRLRTKINASRLSTDDGTVVICVLNITCFTLLLKQRCHAVAHDTGKRGEAFARIWFLKLRWLSAIGGLPLPPTKCPHTLSWNKTRTFILLNLTTNPNVPPTKTITLQNLVFHKSFREISNLCGISPQPIPTPIIGCNNFATTWQMFHPLPLHIRQCSKVIMPTNSYLQQNYNLHYFIQFEQ